ncbi:hypothetical protein [Pasteurella sp. PK-2025]|uniref:hypothetical protein n=1 Tax=Pasteurella sp. PK-2025 TaxID=3413133 RepID=UPI003C78295C
MAFRNLANKKQKMDIFSAVKKIFCFLKTFFPILSLITTLFGFVFIAVYLHHIGRMEDFNRLLSSPSAVIAILFFFLIISVYIFVPFAVMAHFSSQYHIAIKDKTVLFIYAINNPLFILIFTIIFFSASFNVYDQDTKILYFILVACTIIFFLISICIFLTKEYQENKHKLHPLILIGFSFFSLISFIVPLVIFLQISKKDSDFLFILFIYLCLLFIHNSALFSENKPKTKHPYLISFLIFFIFLIFFPFINGSFGLQRAILKVGGMAQYPPQESLYFIKSHNKDYINYIRQHNIFQVEKKSQDEIYISGYLILNLGDVRILCSASAETDNQSQNKYLDPQKCLTFHAQDLMLMGTHEKVTTPNSP